MSTAKSLETFLVPKFKKKHIDSAVRHFEATISEFRAGAWEECIAKAGKFIEAVLKALFEHVGKTPPAGRRFKADVIINGLAQLPSGSFDDTIRLTVPRACRFVYDIASNRGGRHDPEEIDPNEMDANVSVVNSSWILAEMIRYSQLGAMNMKEAREIVESLVERKYPLIEEVDGRIYFHGRKKSAPDVALLALSHRHPKRISVEDLIEIIKRNGFTETNARTAVGRIKTLVDNDGSDGLRLLSPGIEKADQILKSLAS